ncbi:MAG: Hsp20/alpha crystallin family protein [Cyclobacteriaceae bacterium]|nr:Hsp20/alpha crystallin family protein [Cyclobacteriaceae bacterium]
MNIVRYNPGLRNFSNRSFNSILDRFFNDTFDTSMGSRDYSYLPEVDIVETEKTFELELAAPGMKKDDFTIDFNDGKLTISGERKFEKENKDVNYHTRETRYGAFSRSFYLPENVDDSKIKAAYEDGILKVVIPKDEKKELKRTIKVG